MLPPVLEIYVVWHPDDDAGLDVADVLLTHFHGSVFTGLLGGAADVFVRHHGWRAGDDAPRPIPFPAAPPPNGLPQAMLTAVVPVVGTELAAAVEKGDGGWRDYLHDIVEARDATPERVAVFPVVVDPVAAHGTELGRLLGRFHGIGRGPWLAEEPREQRWCRDLVQGVAQFLGGTSRQPGRLRVFISHTTMPAQGDNAEVMDLISRVRRIIGQTRLSEFFSTNALTAGLDWADELRTGAGSSAMLALRTDLYASRPWCQSEMLAAKCAGMPVVVLDAPGHGEQRGSFLMDHVPRIPVRRDDQGWRDDDIRRGLNLLVDECLKQALWRHQQELARSRSGLDISWWAPHAPEPATLLAWFDREQSSGRWSAQRRVRIIHPDPPLGPDERSVLNQMARLGGMTHALDILTPRSLAARGGA